MADTVYSITLGLAMAASALAWIGWAAGRLAASRRRRWARRVRRASAAALALTAVSALVHLLFGHRPGSPQGLAAPAFVAEHQAFVWVALAALVARLLGRRQR